MDLFKAGERPTRRANPDYFIGVVWQDPIIEAPAPARVGAVRVSFEPAARTNWHTHPLGQTLNVLSGVGLIHIWGETASVIRPGDTIWIPPDVKHWHGAAPDVGMVHLAIHEALDGSVADWLDPVSDVEYAQATAAAI